MKANPIHRNGIREVLCPHYVHCLDQAVARHWRYWDCTECTYWSQAPDDETPVSDDLTSSTGAAKRHIDWLQ